MNEKREELCNKVGEPMRSLIEECWNETDKEPTLSNVYFADRLKQKYCFGYNGDGKDEQ